MNKSESKYYNTACLMDEALIKLLAEKELQYISVKEICETAGVNRSTFYLHYETISDLLEETIGYVTHRFNSSFDKTDACLCGHWDELPLDKLVFINNQYLKPYLQFIYDNRSVFEAAANNPVCMKSNEMYSDLKKHIIERIMRRFDIPIDKQSYLLEFYIKGIIAVIQEWLSRDCRESIEQMAEIIESCIFPKLNPLNGQTLERQ